MRHVLAHKLRFAKQSTNPVPACRALKGVSLSGAENARSFYGRARLSGGTGVNGYSVCANVGRTGLLLNYVPNIRLGDFRQRFPMIQALLFNGFTPKVRALELRRALLRVVHVVATVGRVIDLVRISTLGDV